MYKIYADNILIHDDSYISVDDEVKPILPKANVELQINSSGSLTFTITKKHAFYENIQPLKTICRVLRDGLEIFRGRVVSISYDSYATKSVDCEGPLNYLLDTAVPPNIVLKEDGTEDKDAGHYEITPHQFLEQCLNGHNEMAEEHKKIYLGNVTAKKKDKTDCSFKLTSYQQTKGVIEGRLLNVYGGYVFTRVADNRIYLDWLDSTGDSNDQVLAVGENIVDISYEEDTAELWTVLLPVGEDNLTLNEKFIEIPEKVSKYGRIVKVEDFDSENSGDLRRQGEEFIERQKEVDERTFTVKAIDLHYTNSTVNQLKLGDKVRLKSPAHGIDEVFPITACSFDLLAPQNDTYTVGPSVPALSQQQKENEAKIKQQLAANNFQAQQNKNHIVVNAKTIQVNAEDIGVNADRIEVLFRDYVDLRGYFEGVSEELGEFKNEVAIEMDAVNAAIAIRATHEELHSVEEGVSSLRNEVAIELDGVKGELSLKANQEALIEVKDDFDGKMGSFTKRMNSAEIRLNSAEANINLKASKEEVDYGLSALGLQAEEIERRVNKAEIDIDGANAAIKLKADSTTVNRLTTRMSSAEVAINGANAQIALKANQTDLNGLGTRVRSAEVAIDGANAQIALKVNKDGLISEINQSAEAVTIKASKVNLAGYVTANQLQAEVISAIQNISELTLTGKMQSNTIIANSKTTTQDLLANGDVDVGGYTTLQGLKTNGDLTIATASDFIYKGRTAKWINLSYVKEVYLYNYTIAGGSYRLCGGFLNGSTAVLGVAASE